MASSSSSSSSIDLSGSVYCVLTGASQGIGRALAVEISKYLGPNSLMLLLARNEQELAFTAKLCESENVKVVFNSINLATASLKDLNDILKQSLQGRNIIDFDKSLIVHNVGSIGNIGVETERMEDVNELREYYDLNVFNVIALNTQFLKLFAEIEDRVVIVNITSLCAIKPMGGMAYYCSGKAAREMYFKVLAEEKRHIKVLNYSPGPVETSMIEYIISEAVNDNLKEVFTSFKNQGALLKPEMTAAKCLKVLLSGRFQPGQHVDYFDED